MKEIKNVMMNVVMLVTCVLFVPILVLLIWKLLFLAVATLASENQWGNILLQYITAIVGMGLTVGLFHLILKPTKYLFITIKEAKARKAYIEKLEQEIEESIVLKEIKDL